MMIMKNKNGSTLIELLIGLIAAAVLVLTIGVLSSMANSSFCKLNREQQIYNDISYGFKLLQRKVRGASLIAAGNKSAPWLNGQHFLIGSDAFGLYQTSATVTDLVYDNGITKETIFSVPQPGTISLSFPVAITAQSVTISLSGVKDNIPFNMQTTITKRN